MGTETHQAAATPSSPWLCAKRSHLRLRMRDKVLKINSDVIDVCRYVGFGYGTRQLGDTAYSGKIEIWKQDKKSQVINN